MEFVGKILQKALDKETHSSSGGYDDSSQQPPRDYNYGQPPPPQDLPYPWVPRWDDRDQRWYFLNEQTGQTSWTHPGYQQQQPAYGQPPYGQQPYGQPGYSGYEGGGQYYPEQQQPEHKDHTALYAAGGVAAGLAVGAVGTAVVMNGGEEIKENFDEDKARFEQGVEDFPEDAARWTGEKVGEVEQIPDNIEQDWDQAENRIENGWDNAVQDVEDAPEDAAEWVGEQVGEVEQFGDNMENVYDQGEAEGRDEGW